MGSCIGKESSTQWGGEDWGFLSPAEAKEPMFCSSMEQENKATFFSSAAPTGTEVKIKITKKQLEELLSNKVDVKGQSIQQVLTQLLNFTDEYETNQRSWRPALQSIHESEVY